jgi:hypothetical protein
LIDNSPKDEKVNEKIQKKASNKARNKDYIKEQKGPSKVKISRKKVKTGAEKESQVKDEIKAKEKPDMEIEVKKYEGPFIVYKKPREKEKKMEMKNHEYFHDFNNASFIQEENEVCIKNGSSYKFETNVELMDNYSQVECYGNVLDN